VALEPTPSADIANQTPDRADLPDFRMGFDELPWDFERQTEFGRPNRFDSSPLSNVASR
jgi:hypothetical protein